MRFMIFGAGFSARAFAKQSDALIYGTTRSESKFPALAEAGIKPLLFSQPTASTDLLDQLSETTHLIISIAPDGNGDCVLNQPALLAAMKKLEWIGYLSTIGVYGDHQGQWIDENAICRPALPRNQMRLNVETEWIQFAKPRDIPIAILRLAGIYGPGRNAFIKLQQGKAHRIIKPGQVFNRIHSDDIAGVIDQFAKARQSGIFNLSDNEPAPPQDVISYAAHLMGVEAPEEIPFEEAQLSEMARSFYGDNKKISNQKLLKTGYRLKHPDYRTALDTMWLTDNWQ